MKKRILSIVIALAMCVSMLSGCASNDADKENEELRQMIYDLSAEIAELRELLTLPKDSLTGEFTTISDDDEDELNDLIRVQEMNLLDASTSGTKVKARDWSKYTTDSAKSRLSKAEATFYDRLYAICETYINEPIHIVTYGNYNYISSDTARFTDLGLTKEQATDVFWWFKYNNPQYYFCEGLAFTTTDLYISLYDFVLDLDDQAKTTNEMFDKLDSWIAECCDNEVTDWDKIISANKIICENIIYSPAVKAGDKSAAGGKNQSLYSVLMTEDAVCAGYALTFDAMANALGIDTYTVISKTHAWNAAAFSDGSYYFVDVCWNDEANGYNEKFIGVGTEYAAYRDNGAAHHIPENYMSNFAPSISSKDYDNSSNTQKLTAPALYVSGSGSNIVKVEWDAVPNAEKYEYSVYSGTTTYSGKSTENNFLYAILPDGVNSATVKVRTIGSENGRTLYSDNSEITVTVNSTESKPNMPENVVVENPDGIRISWDKDSSVDGWLVITYGEDSTFLTPWVDCTLEKGYTAVRWSSSWQPKTYNYFSVMSIKKSDNAEIYSDPVLFRYNINDGMQLLTRDDSNSGNSSGGKVTSYVTKTYNDGVYIGQMKDGIRNGQGKFTWTDGAVYEGEWKDDKRTGQGVYTWTSGNVYDGEWKDGKQDGRGKYTWADGNVYDGEWKDGKRSGQGKLIWTSGSVYEGEWKDDNQNGQGKLTWVNGNVYEGGWKDGKRNGQGKFTWSNGDVYEGEWKDNTRHGQGKYTWSSGEVYEGGWIDGKYSGQGKLTWPSGSAYEGVWKDSKLISGVMTLQYSNGDVTTYECSNYVDEKINGQATRTIHFSIGDVSILSGMATAGEISGKVTLDYTFASGTYYHYEGEYSGGKTNGQGTKTTYYTDNAYLVETGEFKDGQLYNGTYTVYNADNSVRTNKTYKNGQS